MPELKNILVTICARKGSKGVKNKNIRILNGNPLITYTIKQASEWSRATKIIVSTDSEEIANISKKYGADVPFGRPIELAEDTTPKIPVIRHALKECENYYNMSFDIVVDLDPTSPIRTVNDIENCLNKFNEGKSDTLFSVVNAHKNPYFNMVEEKSDGYYSLSKIIPNINRRQDAPKVYSLNASIYVYSRDYLLDETNNSAISNKSSVYVMDELSGIDIDREIDFKFIEFLIKEKLVHL